MLANRVIPCLDVDQGRVVKGTNFVNLRDAGDPVQVAARYEQEGADELVFLDITASHQKRDIMIDVVRRTADEINSMAATLMEEAEGPFFLFVHYYDPHDPYEYPESVGRRLPADEKLVDLLERRGLKDVQYHKVLNRKQDGPVVENGEVVTLVEMVASYDAGVRYATDHVAELIRQVQAFQLIRETKGAEATPSGWQPGRTTLKVGPDLVGKVWKVWPTGQAF